MNFIAGDVMNLVDAKIAEKKMKALEEDNKMLRKLFWLNHYCESRYLHGSDGEMQCKSCLIDFKNTPVKDIHNYIIKKNEDLLEALKIKI